MTLKAIAGDGTLDLLIAILRDGPPRLTGALCAGRPDLFDTPNATAEHVDRAVGICQRCPALEPCATWAARQRRGQLTGVIGGKRYYSHRDGDRPIQTARQTGND